MTWKQNCSNAVIKARALMLRNVRDFFYKRGVVEVETPILSHYTASDPHINSIVINLENKYKDKNNCYLKKNNGDFQNSDFKKLYLQTSPESFMKRLLANNIGSIFQICKAFRAGEQGTFHNLEFTILEWYRTSFNDKKLMQEVSDFLKIILDTKPAKFISYKELFLKHFSINPHKADIKKLQTLAENLEVSLSFNMQQSFDVDDWLNFFIGNIIQPKLQGNNPWIVFNYPETQAALAKKTKIAGDIVARRFEIFYNGVELGNAYYELQCPKEQTKRFLDDNKKRKSLGLEKITIDNCLIDALKFGLPDCSGIAIGFDRLLMLKLGISDIKNVLTF